MADKILVIDDDADSLELIELMLKRQGYEVVTAQGGERGLAQVATAKPDLIILDIMMPQMDGYEVCRRLRGTPRLASVPIIMFTAKTRVDDKVAGFEAGADDYLTKPTRPAELAARVKAILSRPAVAAPVAAQRSDGKIIAILGAKGGAGVTTIAVNLSVAAADTGRSLILADLQDGAGGIGLHLGHPQAAGLPNLLRAGLQELDQERMRNELIEYAPGMRLLLASSQSAEAVAPLPGDYAERITTILTQMADLVVLDLGSRIREASLRALTLADQIILCLAPERISVAMIKTVLPLLWKNGVRPDQVGLVLLNTVVSATPTTSPEELAEQLDLPILGSITAAPELALQSSQLAQPMIRLQPQSPSARQFRELAQRTIADLEEAATPAQ